MIGLTDNREMRPLHSPPPFLAEMNPARSFLLAYQPAMRVARRSRVR